MIESTCSDCDFNPCVCGEASTKRGLERFTQVLEVESAKNRQVGGSHYKDLPIQPTEYITKNKLGWCEANIVKYITRHSQKGGEEDIKKVIHYAELLLEMYKENN